MCMYLYTHNKYIEKKKTHDKNNMKIITKLELENFFTFTFVKFRKTLIFFGVLEIFRDDCVRI